MSKICLVFDFDNTLAKRDGKWTKSLCNVLDNNNYKNYDSSKISQAFKGGFPWNRYEQAHSEYFNGLTWWGYTNTIIKKAINNLSINDNDEVAYLIREFKHEYLRLDAWSLYDDTIDTLEKSINKGYTNIMLSNHVPQLDDLVQELGIYDYFEHVFTSAKIGYDKPNIKAYEEVYKNSCHEKYYMIGDNYNADILGGINAGFTGILVRKENTSNYKLYSLDLKGIFEFI